MKNSKIAWTNDTFNPWRGCTKVSAGCENCYAERDSKRYGLNIWGPQAERLIASDKYWLKPMKWNKEAEETGTRRQVFCASFADVFEDRPELKEPRLRLWALINLTPNLDWLLLTKRPENVNRMGLAAWMQNGWPDNVWLGTSVENQQQADRRVYELMKVPARVRFLSMEPLLGPVDLGLMGALPVQDFPGYQMAYQKIHWVIVGGESGPKHRTMDEAWARSIRDQCAEAGTAFFMKQLGGLWDKKGLITDLPADLQIRQFPEDRP